MGGSSVEFSIGIPDIYVWYWQHCVIFFLSHKIRCSCSAYRETCTLLDVILFLIQSKQNPFLNTVFTSSLKVEVRCGQYLPLLLVASISHLIDKITK